MKKINFLLIAGLLGASLMLSAETTTRTTNIGGMEFVWIPAGTFMMGSTNGNGAKDEHPLHKVELNAFWIGKYEVTQAQWEDVMGNNPSYSKGDARPAEMISWSNCEEFCRSFNTKNGVTIRLPSEAEWEYAYRAGGDTKYYWGDSIQTNYLVYCLNSSRESHPVGQKQPNNWGLYDMAGNVWEWCNDWYSERYYKSSPSSNPQGPRRGIDRIIRGGSYLSVDGDLCRAAV